jgi:fructokinase
VIAVVGEALIDLVFEDAAGDAVTAQGRPGGGAYNAARTIGRLGQPAVYCGRLAGDGFGDLLRSCLVRDGVRVGLPEAAGCPTTLAVVDLDAAGQARYRFYLDATAAPAVDSAALAGALPDGLTMLHAGTLALVAEPVATAIERLVTGGLPDDVLVMIDPNCRPWAISDPVAYRERLFRILGRADVVKVSVEDLAYLFPGVPAFPDAALRLGDGLSGGIVLVTDGPRPARALLPSGEIRVGVPDVPVRDTIGAGDAFGGAFLAWWSARGLTRAELRDRELVAAALRAAVEVAALTCTRPGADPPWLADVRGRAGWL